MLLKGFTQIIKFAGDAKSDKTAYAYNKADATGRPACDYDLIIFEFVAMVTQILFCYH